LTIKSESSIDLHSDDWLAIYSTVMMSTVHLRFSNIMASLHLSLWPAFQGNTRLIYGLTCLAATNSLAQIGHKMRYCSANPDQGVLFSSTQALARQHLVLIPTGFLRPNAHSSSFPATKWMPFQSINCRRGTDGADGVATQWGKRDVRAMESVSCVAECVVSPRYLL
jgi:hypothetical protein